MWVLVVLVWTWVAVSLAVYGYRIYRRVTQGPKAVREARAAEEEGRAVGLGERMGRRAPLPPLPDGPVEARLPRSLAGQAPPGSPGEPPAGASPGSAPPVPGADRPVSPTLPPTPVTPRPAPSSLRAPVTPAPPPVPAAPAGPPPPPRPTVAEALRGIDLPGELVPVVDAEDPAIAEGYRVLFTTRSATLRAVAAGIADELERLGYEVADSPGGEGGEERHLRAVRAAQGVDVVVRTADDGAVVADVTT